MNGFGTQLNVQRARAQKRTDVALIRQQILELAVQMPGQDQRCVG